ncbi:MAG: hypothetical protein A2Y61_00300 [Chloroflexi bacterium RBG_13_60_13]|nr:MAG: hypothetical protein A2Y61_00300 [Chloroflexi bacterium RBG_13_60_13]
MSSQDMSAQERIEAITRVSMKDKSHLKRWLEASGRAWLVFNAIDLVDALSWPDGVDVLMQVVACYKDHRAGIETGRFEEQVDPTLGKMVRVPIYKGEPLEVEELTRAIRALVGQIKEKDPTWTLESNS